MAHPREQEEREKAERDRAAAEKGAAEKAAAKLTDEEKAAGVSPHLAAAAAEESRADKAERTKAQKEREKAMASAKFVTNHAVGDHAAGAVVERSKFGRFTNDKGEPDKEAYDANLGRLLDLGAITPAPEEEKEEG